MDTLWSYNVRDSVCSVDTMWSYNVRDSVSSVDTMWSYNVRDSVVVWTHCGVIMLGTQ